MKKYGAQSTPLTALVIDDNPIVLSAQSKLLMQFGFQTVKANNPIDALEILQHSPVDFVVTDIEMPDMRGDELAYQIHKKYPELPVIAVTSENLMKLAINEKARFHKVLTKPLTQEKMHFLSFQQQKERCMRKTKLKVVDSPSGKRIFLGSAFPGIYLTMREAELALLLAEYKYHEIAKLLNLSIRTIEFYSANIRKKLRCKNKKSLSSLLKDSGVLDKLKALIDISYLFPEGQNTL